MVVTNEAHTLIEKTDILQNNYILLYYMYLYRGMDENGEERKVSEKQAGVLANG